MKNYRIKTKLDDPEKSTLEIGGWYSGKQTYLWFGDRNGNCLGTIGGRKLYRLTKTIVKHMEGK